VTAPPPSILAGTGLYPLGVEEIGHRTRTFPTPANGMFRGHRVTAPFITIIDPVLSADPNPMPRFRLFGRRA
jgi:hypothetical protein